jgi:hypothetical protein
LKNEDSSEGRQTNINISSANFFFQTNINISFNKKNSLWCGGKTDSDRNLELTPEIMFDSKVQKTIKTLENTQKYATKRSF